MTDKAHIPDILLPKAEVLRRTALSRPTMHRLVAAGDFPRPVQIAVRRVAWRASDVASWIASRQPAE